MSVIKSISQKKFDVRHGESKCVVIVWLSLRKDQPTITYSLSRAQDNP